MPALSPTMEIGNLGDWKVEEGEVGHNRAREEERSDGRVRQADFVRAHEERSVLSACSSRVSERQRYCTFFILSL